MRKPSNPSACKIYKVQMYDINRNRDGAARINACGDSREQNKRPVDVCSAPTGVERRNEVYEAGSPLALDNR